MRMMSYSGADQVERPAELELAAERRDQLDLGAREVDGGGEHEEVLEARGLDAVEGGGVGHDHVVDRGLHVAVVDPEAGRRVALRVEVDHEHAVARFGERGAQVDGGGGLAHPALLVGDRDDPRERQLAGGFVRVRRPSRPGPAVRSPHGRRGRRRASASGAAMSGIGGLAVTMASSSSPPRGLRVRRRFGWFGGFGSGFRRCFRRSRRLRGAGGLRPRSAASDPVCPPPRRSTGSAGPSPRPRRPTGFGSPHRGLGGPSRLGRVARSSASTSGRLRRLGLGGRSS